VHRRRRGSRTRAAVLGLFVGVQLPGVAALAVLTGSWLAAAGFAALVSLPYLPQLAQPWHPPPLSGPRRALLLVFFAWWSACLASWLLGPLALLVGKGLGLGGRGGVLLGALLSLAAGLRALWPRPRVVRHTLAIPGLPRAFENYRIVHLSDVHCGPWTPPARVRRWVARINALSPDLVAVTGDLITTGNDYVHPVAEALGGLRAPDGVFACMGNHDYFTDGEAFAGSLGRAGLTVLRNRGQAVERAGDRLFVAGVDDTWTQRADVPAALGQRPRDTTTVLLAHDPLLFPEAASRGVELILSGHTHGGQIAVPGLHRKLNLARLMTPFTVGLYRTGRSTLHVTRGAGTTGPPIRLGAPSEIAVLTLRAA
jgi:predicted MPP superfamily phosphohydrolase